MNSSTISRTTRRVGLHGVHAPDDLADEVGDEVVGPGAGLVGHPVDAGHGRSDEHRLHRHRQRDPGPSGRSHSSVQVVRSMRAGLPVMRPGPDGVAGAGARGTCPSRHGGVSASSVVSHTDPHHTPSAPRAIPAASWRPLAMPPAASTGSGPTASTTSGTSTIVAIEPGVATGLGALGDDQVGAGLGVLDGVLDRPRRARRPGCRRRGPARGSGRAADRGPRRRSRGRWSKQHVEQRRHALRVDPHARHRARPSLRPRRPGAAARRSGEDVVDERLVLVGQQPASAARSRPPSSAPANFSGTRRSTP